jgi:hypothetical protein
VSEVVQWSHYTTTRTTDTPWVFFVLIECQSHHVSTDQWSCVYPHVENNSERQLKKEKRNKEQKERHRTITCQKKRPGSTPVCLTLYNNTYSPPFPHKIVVYCESIKWELKIRPYETIKRELNRRFIWGVGVMKDKELKVEETETSHTLERRLFIMNR